MVTGFSLIFGLSMVGAAAADCRGTELIVAAAAVLAVAAGTAFRPVAPIAVLLTVLVIVLSEPSNTPAALAGLCAVAYLVSRHSGGSTDVVVGSWPTILAGVGFTFAGLVATAFPLQLPWLPLAAPLGALAVYALAIRPFLG